jgi:hypothetical protein
MLGAAALDAQGGSDQCDSHETQKQQRHWHSMARARSSTSQWAWPVQGLKGMCSSNRQYDMYGAQVGKKSPHAKKNATSVPQKQLVALV